MNSRKLLKIQDTGGQPLCWKIENGQMSPTFWLITAKFGKVTHIGPPKGTGYKYFKLLKIQDGGLPPSYR